LFILIAKVLENTPELAEQGEHQPVVRLLASLEGLDLRNFVLADTPETDMTFTSCIAETNNDQDGNSALRLINQTKFALALKPLLVQLILDRSRQN